MFLHLGENVVIPLKEVIAIFDIDSLESPDSKHFLKVAEEEGFIKKVNKDRPKSFVLTERNKKSIIYLSPISSVTLVKRSGFVDEL
jgi:extracellular matrix regulatory protein B